MNPPEVVAATEVLQAHKRHVDNPSDHDLRDAFLLNACRFFLHSRNDSCILHNEETPNISIELLSIFALRDLDEAPIKTVLDKLGNQLTHCYDCQDAFAWAKRDFKERYRDTYDEEVLRSFFDAIHVWKVGRQKIVLGGFLEKYNAVENMTAPVFKKLRNEVTCTLGDIWRFPETLQDRELDQMWVDVLHVINAGTFSSPLKLDNEVVDAGGVLAVGHADKEIRRWSRTALRTAGAPMVLETSENYETSMGILTQYFEMLSDPKEDRLLVFNYTTDATEVWRAIVAICFTFTSPSFQTIMLAEKHVNVQLCKMVIERLGKAEEDFWDIIWLFGTLLHERVDMTRFLDTNDKRTTILKTIVSHPIFQSGISDDTFVRERSFSISWLHKFVMASSFFDPMEHPADDVLKIALKESENWCQTAVAVLDGSTFHFARRRFTGQTVLISYGLACHFVERLLTKGDTKTHSLEDLVGLVRVVFESDPSIECMKLGHRCLKFISESLCKAVAEDPLNLKSWFSSFTCVDGALEVAFRWSQVGDKVLVTAFIEDTLSVAELALELLATKSDLIEPAHGQALQTALHRIVKCFMCNDAKVQSMAYSVTRELVRILLKANVGVDPAVSSRLIRLAKGEQRSMLSATQKTSMLTWIPEYRKDVKKEPSPVVHEIHEISEGVANVSDEEFEVIEPGNKMEATRVSASSSRPKSLEFFSISNKQTDAPKKSQSSLDKFVSRDESDLRSVWERLANDANSGSLDKKFGKTSASYAIGKKSLQPTIPKKGTGSKLKQLRDELASELGKTKPDLKPSKQAVVPLARQMPHIPYQGPGDSGMTIVPRGSGMPSVFAPSERATSTIMIDSKGLPIKPTGAPKRGVPIRAPGDTRPAPLRSISSLYEQVLSWNTDLEGDRPPNFPFELRSIPNSFQNGDREYAMTFEPLLILECWEQLQKAKEELNSEDNLITKLTSVAMVDAFHDITITAAGKDVRLRGWSENDVLRMIQMGPPNQETNKSFLCKVNSVIYKGDEAVVQARMFVGSNTSLIPILRTNSKWRSIRTYSLTTAIREYSSICTLPSLSLRNDILQPAKTPRAQPKKTEISMMMDRYGLNQPQAAAISAALTQNAGFTLIQGPPGTGKTKTILGLISAFLSQHTIIKVPGEEKRPKSNRLLCCAPSNAAIDEIVRRLKIGISGPSGTFVPKIVRIGAGEAIHSSVRDVTLDSLLEKMLEESGTLEVEDKQDEIRRAMNALKDEREQLRAHENDADIDAAKAEEINSQIAVVSKKLAAMHEKLTKERQERSTAALARDKYKRQLKRKLLLEADVILTTLSGAGSDVLGDLPDLTFPTVIVDEAAQSVELSTIIPLRYGAKKCVLVGDPQQLPPTVLSQVGQGHRYEQSLFQRIMNNSPDVTHLLSISYRMHPQISSYVSRAFYGGKLQDAPGMSDISKAPWHSDPLYPPYQLVDMHSGREQTGRGHSYYNSDEARLCADLVETLCLRYPKYNFVGKIGVITFYKKQVREIKNALIRRGWSREVLQNLDVNTVDGFQGQEKEIIILSCVRANRQVGFISDVRRMNVAMSRAKYSLIVLGNVDTLQTHRVWRHLVDDAFDRRMVVRSSDAMFKLRNGAGPPPANLSTPTRMLESSDVSTDSSDDAPSVGTSGSKRKHKNGAPQGNAKRSKASPN